MALVVRNVLHILQELKKTSVVITFMFANLTPIPLVLPILLNMVLTWAAKEIPCHYLIVLHAASKDGVGCTQCPPNTSRIQKDFGGYHIYVCESTASHDEEDTDGELVQALIVPVDETGVEENLQKLHEVVKQINDLKKKEKQKKEKLVLHDTIHQINDLKKKEDQRKKEATKDKIDEHQDNHKHEKNEKKEKHRHD
eukprot:Awhi_evm1s4061